MDKLDQKLSLILEDQVDYCNRPERFAVPLKVGEQTFVEQIKQAFRDAGYTQAQMDAEGRVKVSGQEWYDRFIQELEKPLPMIPGNGYSLNKIMLEAAKKAAGLK